MPQDHPPPYDSVMEDHGQFLFTPVSAAGSSSARPASKMFEIEVRQHVLDNGIAACAGFAACARSLDVVL